LLIAIPVAIIGAISLAAKRSIIIKKPMVLEQADRCRTVIFDKTGTLTYGEPKLVDEIVASGWSRDEILGMAASLERYSKHPLARAILSAADDRYLKLADAANISEPPGRGLRGTVTGREVRITSRGKLLAEKLPGTDSLPPHEGGLECFVVIDGHYAAAYRFRDAPRADGLSFIQHLGPRHSINRLMIVSGDRESEVRYLAEEVGITEIHAQKTPEEKLDIVRHETTKAKTMYVGDGINDAPAMMAATVGIAVGQNSDITAEAAGVVIMNGALKKVDEFMHISRNMRVIALQSAVGGMGLSIVAMIVAASGHLTPVAGALCQELIDVVAVLNALRAAWPSREMSDF
jgi:P-type E1-E2 ATPase